MPKTIDDATAFVAEFCAKYRRPEFGVLTPSDLYDLHPEVEPRPKVSPLSQWPHSWPGSGPPGVYILLNERQEVIYVGKASMGNVLGKRLGAYFQYEPGTPRCRAVHRWDSVGGEPRFVVTVPVRGDMSFEAAALEEFLIGRLDPPGNTLGRGSR